MKILVAVKRVIDYNVQVRVKEDGSWEILEILGRHEQAYERKKVYE